MKKTVIIVIIILLFQNIKAQDYDLLISTYDTKNAKIFITKSEFVQNTFTISFSIKWVNSKLKAVKENDCVLAVLKDEIEIYPKGSVDYIGDSHLTDFRNDSVNVTFYANPDFEGGDILIIIPVVSAENIEKAQLGEWKEVLYSQAKQLKVNYFIDATKIIDTYPPIVSLISPVKDPESEENIPVVNDKKAKISFSVIDKSGIEKVTINGLSSNTDNDGNYFATITFFTGENTIKVKATDVFGNESVSEFDILCTYQYDLDTKGGNYYALLIAVQDYDDKYIPDLDKPLADADSLKNVLTQFYTFEEENVYYLKNPTRSEMIAKLEYLSENITESDNLLVFYAGHGYWDEKKEIGYWLPSDADVSDFSTWIANSTIKDYIGAIKSKHTLMVTDACFGGSIFKTRGLQTEKVVAYQKIYDLTSRKGMTSGTLTEVPDESIFLSMMIKKLAQNDDKYLSVSVLFTSMRDAVLNNSETVPQYGTIQGVGDEGGEFIFIKK